MIRTNTFALIRLLPMSDRDKDVEILALRHQPAVLQRMAGKPAFTPNDRTLLAALLHHLPTQKLRQLHLDPHRFRRHHPKWHDRLRGENRKWDRPVRSTPRNIRMRLWSW
jgi:hypothetical protein